MKKNNLHIIIAAQTFCIMAICVGYYFFYDTVMQTGQRMVDLAEKNSRVSKDDELVRQTLVSLKDVMSKIDQIDSYLVAPDGEVAFINQLEDKAKNLGLSTEINNVQIEKNPAITNKGLEYLSLKISVKGSWTNVYRFTVLLSSLPYQITVSQADVVIVSDKEVKTTVWEGDFVIKVLKKTK